MATRDYVIRRPRAAALIARDCPDCTRGWVTFCNEAAPIGKNAAAWIRRSPYAVTEQSGTVAGALSAGVTVAGEIDAAMDPATTVTVFRFPGGQPCFRHPAPPRFYAGSREHVRLGDWIEDLDEHVSRLEEQIRKG